MIAIKMQYVWGANLYTPCFLEHCKPDHALTYFHISHKYCYLSVIYMVYLLNSVKQVNMLIMYNEISSDSCIDQTDGFWDYSIILKIIVVAV